jgi:hypothetical protein
MQEEWRMADVIVTEPEMLNPENPWPGLKPFTEQGKSFFHGREDQVIELGQRVAADRVTVLFGQSGLGKTSLLNAGLFPHLRTDNLLPIYVRLQFGQEESPVEQITKAIVDNFNEYEIEFPPFIKEITLWGYFHSRNTEFWNRWNQLVIPVLVFDQFEELFTRGRNGDDETILLEELSALTEKRLPESVQREIEADPERASGYDFGRANYKIILSLREEFLPELEDLGSKMPSVLRNRMRLAPMNGLQARSVVIQSGGQLIAKGVAERIILFVAASRSNQPDINLTDQQLERLEILPALISIVCHELNEKRKKKRPPVITADLLSGSQSEIISEFYNSGFAAIDPLMRVFIEDQLLTSDGFRDSCSLTDALRQPGVTRMAIQQLEDHHLLRLEDRRGTQWIELTHDLLTDVVRQQRDLRRQRSQETQEAEARERVERERAEQAETEARRQEVLAKEANERARQARLAVRRTKIWLAAMTLFALIASGATFFALVTRQELKVTINDLQIERQDLSAEAQRARGQLIKDEIAINSLANYLAATSPPENKIWPYSKMQIALSMLGNHAKSVQKINLILNTHQKSLSDLGSRGYEYLILGKPEEAIRDINGYLEFDKSINAYVNLGIANAMRRDYESAISDFKNAIGHYRLGADLVFDSEVAPEIQRATRHNVLFADGATMLSAAHYTIAALRAFAGDPDFEATLDVATATYSRDPRARDAYLLALNWVWLIVRGQADEQQEGPADYGVLGAEGALWERMGDTQARYYVWAREAYERFEAAYKARPLPRYASLAQFVSRRLRDKKFANIAISALPPPTDPWELAADARAATVNESENNPLSYATRERILKAAIDQLAARPADEHAKNLLVQLYLQRAQLRLRAHDPVGSRDDISRVLTIASNLSDAYRLRADSDFDDSMRRQDYQHAIDEDPMNEIALENYAEFLQPSDPAKSEELLKQRLRIVDAEYSDYEKLARVQLKLGKKDDALISVNTAITMRSDLISLYILRSDIQTMNSVPEMKRRLDLISGYCDAAKEMARVGTDASAISTYMRALSSALTLKGDTPHDEDVHFVQELAIRGLSELLASRYGAPYVTRFWTDIVGSISDPNARDRITAEARRFSLIR